MMDKLLPKLPRSINAIRLTQWVLISAITALSACTTYPVYVDPDYEAPPRTGPAGTEYDEPDYGEYPQADGDGIEEPKTDDKPETKGLPDWAVIEPDTKPPTSIKPMNPAVKSLLSTSLEQRRLGDFSAAFSTLERALRISPREAKVYYAMAEVRYEQKQLSQAEQFARKAVSLASSDLKTKGEAWQLIASVRAEKGDWDGEQHARNKARALKY